MKGYLLDRAERELQEARADRRKCFWVTGAEEAVAAFGLVWVSEIARTKPATIEELRHVKGVGDRKSADLGELILSIIATP